MRRSVYGDGVYVLRIFIFWLYFAMILCGSMSLIDWARPRIVKLKRKKTVFSLVVLAASVVISFIALKCCESLPNGLLLAAFATSVFAIGAGAVFFDKSPFPSEKKDEIILGVERRHRVAPCLAVGALFLFSNHLYQGCGCSCITSLLVFMAGFFLICLIIGIYGEMKN